MDLKEPRDGRPAREGLLGEDPSLVSKYAQLAPIPGLSGGAPGTGWQTPPTAFQAFLYTLEMDTGGLSNFMPPHFPVSQLELDGGSLGLETASAQGRGLYSWHEENICPQPWVNSNPTGFQEPLGSTDPSRS